ncbi:MAG TPA: hypothetical protein VJP02_15995 [Candidatus Sulfotelmatobacter sp.]|nr:hypothetical protein [Candidatus Sulfotelmatobacter sp.]
MNTKPARSSGHKGDSMERLTTIRTAATALRRSAKELTKHAVILALILNLGVAAAYAHDVPVKMTFSGTSDTSATNLQQPDASNDADTFSGKGTLGPFTARNIRAISNSPGRPALARAQLSSFSRNWPVPACFASRMGAC